MLVDGAGAPVVNAAPARKRSTRRRDSHLNGNTRRDPLTAQNWPAYNSTGAPTTTRSNFALAQGPEGKVVIAGGNDEDVLVMFNARQNSWEDADEQLGQFMLLSQSSTSRNSDVDINIGKPCVYIDHPVAAAADDSGPPLNTILGAALGGFFGLALLLILAYLCIRRRKRRKAHMEAGHLRRASGPSSSEKDNFGFDKETLVFGPPPGGFRGHQPQGSQSSFSSMAILMGRTGQQKSTHSVLSRKTSNESRRESSDDTFRAFKSTISKPIPQVTPAAASAPPRPPPPRQQQPLTRDEKGVAFAASTAEPRPRNLTAKPKNDDEDTTRRSSGWNRYWSGGSALNLLGFGSGNRTGGGGPSNGPDIGTSQRATMVSDRSSNYSDPHRMTQDSVTVPPLFPRNPEPRMSLSRVTAHSPTIAIYDDKFEGLSGRIETGRPVSAVSDMSASAYSSGIPESVQEAWDPTAANKPWGGDRVLNNSATGIYSTQLAPPVSQATRSVPQAPPRPPPPRQQGQAPVRDDMSWLNLGGS
ncbi:hypothetical protein N0V88_004538 [Collariella sp. IMI 366227]|nr:hypothetical protein N0V88_004538 [Collariella sp. IMI 366227]